MDASDGVNKELDSSIPEEIEDWIAERAGGGITALSLLPSSPRSTIVRLVTSAGATLYFKADHILPPPEATILARLTQRWPLRVPRLIALDEGLGWTLTRDAGETMLADTPKPVWCRVAQSFAEMGIDSGLAPEEWLDLGCRDLSGPALFAAIDRMLTDAAPHLEARVSDGLAALRPRIAAACDELATDGITRTLVHQDLVPVNIAVRESEPVFLDWSDTVVGHPFFGFDRLLDSCWTDVALKSAVIDAYLDAFSGQASDIQLRASFDRVLSLRVLYECVRWHHEIATMDSESEHAQRLFADMRSGLASVVR